MLDVCLMCVEDSILPLPLLLQRTVDTASGQHPLELNPYWKEGGSGLPQDREHSSRDRKRSKVGDGGRSWILRAYKRAIQAAEEEGRSLEEVASERWGSMGKLQSLLQSAGINPAYPDHSKTGKKELLFSNIADRRDYSMERDYDGKGEEKGKGKGRMGGKKCANPDHYLPKKGTHVEKFLRPGESGPKLPSSSLVSLGPSPSSSSQHWRKTVSAGSPTGCADIPSHSCIRVSEHGPEHSNASMSMERNPTPCDRKHGSIGEEQGGSESVTDADMNAVSAKLMKAEMRGRSDEVERLTKELGELRQARERQAVGPVVQPVPGRGEGKGGHGDGARELLLATTDRFGHTRPVKLSSSAVATASSHASGRMRTHAKKGRKDKFFADDDQYSLSALVKQERQTTAEEMHAAIANMSAKFVPAGIAGETVDDAVDSAAASKLNPGKEGQRRQQRAMLESRQQTEALDKCRLCLGSPHFSKSLLVAVGLAAYLAVPAYQSLVEGHCLIVPMEHASSCLVLDENVWSEMQIFRKGLVHMFAGQDKDVVFMETCRNLRFKTHTVVEAIPLPRDAGALAPMYFKKAILESDEEWAQNRKLIDTSKKGLRHSIPAGLPYFSIEFGMDGGFGHVIEDLDKFPAHFGAEVVGGLLEVEPRLWLRPPPESFEARRQKVEELSANWAPFDWTQQLKDK